MTLAFPAGGAEGGGHVVQRLSVHVTQVTGKAAPTALMLSGEGEAIHGEDSVPLGINCRSIGFKGIECLFMMLDAFQRHQKEK